MNGKALYTGELNAEDDAHGEGKLVCKTGVYEGTFRNKKLDGFCKYFLRLMKLIGKLTYTEGTIVLGEIKDSNWNGKRTTY